MIKKRIELCVFRPAKSQILRLSLEHLKSFCYPGFNIFNVEMKWLLLLFFEWYMWGAVENNSQSWAIGSVEGAGHRCGSRLLL